MSLYELCTPVPQLSSNVAANLRFLKQYARIRRKDWFLGSPEKKTSRKMEGFSGRDDSDKKAGGTKINASDDARNTPSKTPCFVIACARSVGS